MKIKIYAAMAIVLFAIQQSLHAQSGMSLGIGGLTAPARGVEAVFWNPANLAFAEKNRPKFQMTFFSVTAGTGNNSFSFNSLTKYIGDGESTYLTEKDKQDILEQVASDGLKFDVSSKISLFSFSINNFGFGIETKAYGNFSVPKDIYQNILFKLGQETYDYSIKAGGFGVTKFKFSYGRTFLDDLIFELPLMKNTIFKEISAGVSLSYLLGTGFAQIDKGTAQLTISENGILPVVDFRAKIAQMGGGFGMDLGLSSYTNNNWKIGLVLENILGQIVWNRKPKMARYQLDFGKQPLFILGEGQLSEIEMDSVSTDTSMSLKSFAKNLPFNFRMGVAKDFGKYLVNFELANENKIFSSALGGRIRFGFFNWCASIGRMLNNFNWNTAVALDFKNFYFDLGVSSRGGLTLGYTKALFIGTSLRFGF